MASIVSSLSNLSTPPPTPHTATIHPKSEVHTYIPSPNPLSPPNFPLEVSQSKVGDTLSKTQIHEIVTFVQPDLEKEGSLVVDLLNPQGIVRDSKPHNKNIAWNSLLKVKPQSAGIEELSYCEPVFKNGFLQIDDV
ncbi:hypothetical protein FRX31_017986 [Thalictrum thalictroides]|uniref:Uncharacterized protein n=1 Tax=Thalictrum thalictroides TaxID=46969 RepID=A0A7J6W6M1_THATH|nr:hypothetical protein FRX31_017986 [Thalictrum thalictroides]